MTIPNDDAPYESDIRASTSSGLGGLFLQLAAIANGLATLPAIAANVAQIAADVRRFAGTADDFGDWPGIVNYLQYVVGNYGPAELQNNPINGRILSVLGIVTNVRNGLFGNTNNPQNAQLTAIRDAVNGAILNNIVEQLAELRVLNDVNGRPLTEPSGVTNKFLLNAIEVNTRRAADCCEEGSGGEPDPDNPLNDPPVNFGCPNAIRVSSWANRGAQNVSGVESTLWQATFNTLPTGITQVLSTSTPGSSYGIATSPTKYDLCISWNFNQNALQPNGFGRNRNSNPQTAANDNFANGPTASGASFIVGGLVDELSNCVPDDPEHDFCGYIFRVPGTEPPALNAFLSSIERSCAV